MKYRRRIFIVFSGESFCALLVLLVHRVFKKDRYAGSALLSNPLKITFVADVFRAVHRIDTLRGTIFELTPGVPTLVNVTCEGLPKLE
jgi:hypothetical protein